MAVRRTTLFLVVIPSSTFTATTIYTNSYVWLDALDTCIIPFHLYASQTWSLTTKHKNIEFCQRKRVRKILGVSTTNRISNTQLQELSMLKSAAQQASRSKWKWVGHVPRLHHTRWAQAITMWDPYRGMPSTRLQNSTFPVLSLIPSFSLPDVLCDPTDIIWRRGTPI